MDLQHFRRSILAYWVGPSHQSRSCNPLYRRARASAAARELARASGGRPLTKGYRLVAERLWTGTFQRTPLPKGAQFWFKANDGFWWLGNIASPTADPDRYIVRFLDDPGPVRLALDASLYTTAPDAVRGSWCLQTHVSGGISAGLLRNADDSRAADIITFADPASTSQGGIIVCTFLCHWVFLSFFMCVCVFFLFFVFFVFVFSSSCFCFCS